MSADMIPEYPRSNIPLVSLGNAVYDLSDVDFIMWYNPKADYEVSASGDDDATYDSFIAANEWRVVLKDDTVLAVKQSSLDSDTREHLINLAFPG